MINQPNYYAIIPANVRYSDIPPNAKLLYGEITALCGQDGHCWATNSYFAELYEKSESTISVWVSHLVKKGFIELEIEFNFKRKIYLKGVLEKSKGGIRKIEGGVLEKSKYNNTINNTIKEEDATIVAKGSDSIRILSDYVSDLKALKSDIGQKHFEQLASLCNDKKNDSIITQLFEESKFIFLVSFLVQKKSKRKNFSGAANMRTAIRKKILPFTVEDLEVAVDEMQCGDWDSIHPKHLQRNSTNTNEALNDCLLPEPENEVYQQYITGIIDKFPNIWRSKCKVLSKSEWHRLSYDDESIFKNIRIALTPRKAAQIRKEMHLLFEQNHFERIKYPSIYDAIVAEYRRHLNHEKTLVA